MFAQIGCAWAVRADFEQQDGKYVGPANETSVSYVIEENGVAKEYFISNTNTYNCRMQILGYREGTIKANSNDNSFEFQPTSGYYSSVSCMSKTKTKKPYGDKDLYPNYGAKLYVEKDGSGSPMLVAKNYQGGGELQLKKIRQANNSRRFHLVVCLIEVVSYIGYGRFAGCS